MSSSQEAVGRGFEPDFESEARIFDFPHGQSTAEKTLSPIDQVFTGQSTGITQDPHVIHAARSLTAREYLAQGYINESELAPDGTISVGSDPYVQHSSYYVVVDKDGRIAATTRKILYDPEKGSQSFPVWEHRDQLYPQFVDEIETIGLDNCVEISALAKDRARDTQKTATLELYRSLYRDAIKTDSPTGVNERAFLMALDPKLYDQFKTIFGGGLERIGPNLDYPGEEVIPAILRTVEGSVGIINEAGRIDNEDSEAQKFVVRYMLEDCTSDTLDSSILSALEKNGFSDVLEQLKLNSENAKKKDLSLHLEKDLVLESQR